MRGIADLMPPGPMQQVVATPRRRRRFRRHPACAARLAPMLRSSHCQLRPSTSTR